ncbi:MAG: azurin [Verrucomicrobiales bacterium]|jgi:azurin
MKSLRILTFLACALGLVLPAAAQDKPHAVFVIGTPHYNPAATMPPLAKQLEENFGFKTTVVSTDYNAEKNAKGIPGLEVLAEADVAIFFLRFLTLPENQMAHIDAYLKSGKPVVGFRTSTHAFSYPKDHKLASWNHGFGLDAMGSKYFIHGQGATQVSKAADHEILTGIDLAKPRAAAGTLYLSELPDSATVLLTGEGTFKRTGTIKNGFGTHKITSEMTDDVAWTWKTQWGGRVFGTTLGHPNSFADENWVRLAINGIHWAAGKPVPGADAKVAALKGGLPQHAKPQTAKPEPPKKVKDAKNTEIDKPAPAEDPDLAKYAIYANSAPRAPEAQPIETKLPLELKKGDSVAFIGNTLFDRAQDFGYFEAMLHQAHPELELKVRNLTWSADAVGIEPRPSNFADTEQHLFHEKVDVIFAAYGFNESFEGEVGVADFREKLTSFVVSLKSKAFNGESAPQIVLVSPIPNENVPGVAAADRNNANIALYSGVMAGVAADQKVGFANVFEGMSGNDKPIQLTINGCHLNDYGYHRFGAELFVEVFKTDPPKVDEKVREMVVEKNKQYFRRYRPVNTFYYTGGRNKTYGYLDFLPAMRNFDMMAANRDGVIWARAQGKMLKWNDDNIPPLPPSKESRGANEWLSAADELAAFKVDPRFEVNLFAGEEEFPEIACPIQMRWDSQGRMWVSCSTTYPHVYPGNEPNDKLVILEDTDGDGKADKSTVFADDLHIPLSFEFGDGGVYVSEEPHLTFIKDTDGDGKADFREKVLMGFGCEDSHHALHDFAWTPDGDLIFRESIFHHSQVETPYGPVRQLNSGWFRFEPRSHRLTSFGTYHSTNPWGVTFDDWGQHMASHPVFAQAFHALDPRYPEQHPKPAGLQAYSGTCGQEFVDFDFWPEEMQGNFIKVRYKPTNRVEIHKWNETEFGFEEEYVSDLIFSTNLSFIPVDLRSGPRGAMYVCDWYNPVKGHAQYSLRDPRRDRESGRIWRIVPKDATLTDPPKIADEPIGKLLEILKAPQYRYRYWAKRDLRERDPAEVKVALDKFVAALDPEDPRHRHHQMEAVWMYRGIEASKPDLLVELLRCEDHNARAAATKQLAYWFDGIENAQQLLNDRANDQNPIVRMEAAIAASYIGTEDSLVAMLDTLDHAYGKHLAYAIRTSLGSHSLKRHWEHNEPFNAAHPELREFYDNFGKSQKMQPTTRSAQDSQFDSQKNVKVVELSCVKEQMLFTVTKIEVKAGQPIKLTLKNPDATPHNWALVQPGTLEEIGMAANLMAADPKLAKDGQFIPKEHKSKIIIHTKMLNPETAETLRFKAPEKPGIYPFMCTFPGHWLIMKGELIVK